MNTVSHSSRRVLSEQLLSPLDKVLDALAGWLAGCPKLEVLWSVVVPHAVGMVHALIWSQKTTECGLEDHSMLRYETSHSCGMLGYAKLHIASGVDEPITARRAQVGTGIAVTLDAIPMCSTPAGRIGGFSTSGIGTSRAVLPSTIPVDVVLATKAACHHLARASPLLTCSHHRAIIAQLSAVGGK